MNRKARINNQLQRSSKGFLENRHKYIDQSENKGLQGLGPGNESTLDIGQFEHIESKQKERFKTENLWEFSRNKEAKYKIKEHYYSNPLSPPYPLSRSLPQELAEAQKEQTDLLDFPETRMVSGIFYYSDCLLRCMAFNPFKKNPRQQDVLSYKNFPTSKINRPVWGWLQVFTIMACGFCMMFFATVTTIIFDRLKQKLVMRTYNGCHKETQSCSFKEIEDVSIVKKGFFDNQNNSIHYVIRISTPEKKFDLMESGERKNMKERVRFFHF